MPGAARGRAFSRVIGRGLRSMPLRAGSAGCRLRWLMRVLRFRRQLWPGPLALIRLDLSGLIDLSDVSSGRPGRRYVAGHMRSWSPSK